MNQTSSGAIHKTLTDIRSYGEVVAPEFELPSAPTPVWSDIESPLQGRLETKRPEVSSAENQGHERAQKPLMLRSTIQEPTILEQKKLEQEMRERQILNHVRLLVRATLRAMSCDQATVHSTLMAVKNCMEINFP